MRKLLRGLNIYSRVILANSLACPGHKQDDDILEKLLHLNLELAEKEKQGEKIIGPWAVDNPPKP